MTVFAMFLIAIGVICVAVAIKVIVFPIIGQKLDEAAMKQWQPPKEAPGGTKTFSSYIHGLNYENEDGKNVIDVILRAARKAAKEKGSFYNEVRKSDFDEDPTLEVSEFEDVPLDCELGPTSVEGKPAVKVWLTEDGERRGAGWIPAEDADYVTYLIRTYETETTLRIEGGKTKVLAVDDNGEKIEIEKEDYFPVVFISYTKE